MTPEQFKKARKKLKMTQEEMATAIGKSVRSVRYYESGGRNVNETISNLIKILLVR